MSKEKQKDDARGPELTRRQLGGLALGAGLGAIGLTASREAGASGDERRFRPFPPRPRRKPNILFILADDLGAADLSSYGAVDTFTPNLDWLAREGLRFTSAYSASAVCSPTRFALYTGRFPGRLPGGLPEPIAIRGPEFGIPPAHPTLASLLKAQGYETALYGKWHCGFLPWFSPLKSGWDEFFGNLSGAIDYFSHVDLDGASDLYEAEIPVEEIGYYTDLVADRAVDFIARRQDRPWLLNVNFTTPHWPWEGRGDQAESDRLTALSSPGSRALFHNDGGSLGVFAEMVTTLDESVGRLLRALDRSRQDDDTIVVFGSDNGGERFSYQWPLRDAKGSVYEGGIRVPQILRWPGVVGRRQVSDVPIVTHDWTATLLEIGGAAPDPAHPLDGVSLAPWLLRGAPAPERDLFWRMRGKGALRRGDWKYVTNTTAAGATQELYHLASDPSERANLAARDPATLGELRAAWEATHATLLPYPA